MNANEQPKNEGLLTRLHRWWLSLQAPATAAAKGDLLVAEIRVKAASTESDLSESDRKIVARLGSLAFEPDELLKQTQDLQSLSFPSTVNLLYRLLGGDDDDYRHRLTSAVACACQCENAVREEIRQAGFLDRLSDELFGFWWNHADLAGKELADKLIVNPLVKHIVPVLSLMHEAAALVTSPVKRSDKRVLLKQAVFEAIGRRYSNPYHRWSWEQCQRCAVTIASIPMIREDSRIQQALVQAAVDEQTCLYVRVLITASNPISNDEVFRSCARAVKKLLGLQFEKDGARGSRRDLDWNNFSRNYWSMVKDVQSALLNTDAGEDFDQDVELPKDITVWSPQRMQARADGLAQSEAPIDVQSFLTCLWSGTCKMYRIRPTIEMLRRLMDFIEHPNKFPLSVRWRRLHQLEDVGKLAPLLDEATITDVVAPTLLLMMNDIGEDAATKEAVAECMSRFGGRIASTKVLDLWAEQAANGSTPAIRGLLLSPRAYSPFRVKALMRPNAHWAATAVVARWDADVSDDFVMHQLLTRLWMALSTLSSSFEQTDDTETSLSRLLEGVHGDPKLTPAWIFCEFVPRSGVRLFTKPDGKAWARTSTLAVDSGIRNELTKPLPSPRPENEPVEEMSEIANSGPEGLSGLMLDLLRQRMKEQLGKLIELSAWLRYRDGVELLVLQVFDALGLSLSANTSDKLHLGASRDARQDHSARLQELFDLVEAANREGLSRLHEELVPRLEHLEVRFHGQRVQAQNEVD